ncbi:MAG TPA: hypothetical protein VFC63_00120, partial [Blastocatellia bacterium]|nr:hypothetical protein [Blastocatellia bacterium]
MKREIPAVSFPRQKPEPANKIRQQSRPALQTLNSAHKPVAPAVYRPQPLPKVLQPKTTAKQPANASIATKRNVPVAPPVYRPATVAKTVLAMKDRKQESNPKSGAGPGFHSRPVGVTGPQKVSVTQLKTSPKAPPVYRPNPVPKVL